ncbi:basic region leucine zipper, partial [Ancylostoma duodenale]
ASADSPNSNYVRPETPVITLAPDQPVTIVGGDGKEYRVVLQTVKESSSELKRKADTAASSPVPKRARGIPLTSMTVDEINSRKREQNRIAAQRYRQKQRKVKCSEKEEEERLMKRNDFLRSEATRLQEEIAGLKEALIGSLRKTGKD